MYIYIYFFKVPSNFSPSYGTGENFLTRPEGSGKTEKPNFNKLAENGDGAKRKRQDISSSVFLTLTKLVSMDAELNSAFENKRYSCQVIGCGTWKSSQTSKSGLKFKKNDLCDRKAQDRQIVAENPLHILNPRNRGSRIG